MLAISPGGTYKASRVRSGSNENGMWKLVVVKEDRGIKEITVWLENPGADIQEGGSFTLKNITEVKYSARKVGEKWYDTVSVKAEVEGFSLTDTPSGFEDIEEDFGELPFSFENDFPYNSEDQLPL